MSPQTKHSRKLHIDLNPNEASILLRILNHTINALWDSHGDIFGRDIMMGELPNGDDHYEFDDPECPY